MDWQRFMKVSILILLAGICCVLFIIVSTFIMSIIFYELSNNKSASTIAPLKFCLPAPHIQLDKYFMIKCSTFNETKFVALFSKDNFKLSVIYYETKFKELLYILKSCFAQNLMSCNKSVYNTTDFYYSRKDKLCYYYLEFVNIYLKLCFSRDGYLTGAFLANSVYSLGDLVLIYRLNSYLINENVQNLFVL